MTKKAKVAAKRAKLAGVKKTVKTVKAKGGNGAAIKGDGLGREGTLTRFICEALVAGQENEKIYSAAAKKFPDTKVNKAYPAWYRCKLVKQGVLKASQKAA